MKVRNTSVLVTSTAMACLVFLLAACGNGGDASTDSTPSPVTSTASFIPASTLAPLATYTSTFTTVITDLGGNALASEFFWGVTTADVMWSTPALIDMEDVGSAYNPQIAFDASGNAIAVWVQSGRTPHSISTNMVSSVWANRYVAGTGWGTAELVEVETGFVSFPQIAVDASGNAIAVWSQSDGTHRHNIWANRYAVGTGWGTAELIEMNDGDGARSPQIAVDARGNAIAVWSHKDDPEHGSIWANRYIAGTGWDTAELIEIDDKGTALNPQIAVDASGNAIAVWIQYDGTRKITGMLFNDDGTRENIWRRVHNIRANRYVAGMGWGAAERIDTDNEWFASEPQIAIDASGNAIAVWSQIDGAHRNIWANRYIAGTGWGTAELIEMDDSGVAAKPQIAVDARSNAIAVWSQSDGIHNNIWANRYIAGMGWDTAELIEMDDTGHTFDPQIDIDASGNAIAVWSQDDGTTFWLDYHCTRQNIWANRYVAGKGWGTAERFETDDRGNGFIPQIAVDAKGNAIAVWPQVIGTGYHIFASRFE